MTKDRSRRARQWLLAAGAAAGLALPASASAATVSGTVFNDFNTNGVLDTSATGGAVDRGVAGLTVRAIGADGTLVATTTTGADGGYSLAAPDGPVRLELSVPAPYQDSRELGSLKSDVRFLDASSAQTGVDFGVHVPAQYSVDNPLTYFAVQWLGPADGDDADAPALRGLPYFGASGFGNTLDPGLVGAAVPNLIAADHDLATFGQIGTTFGLAQDPADDDIYAGAYYKRYAGLTAAGAGAIFKVTQGGIVTNWATLAAGSDDHPTSSDVRDWDGTVAKDGSWADVGNHGLGSVKVDPATRSLYTINLLDKRLVRLSLDGAAPGTLPADTGTPIPDPHCEGGNWRPFSIGLDEATGSLYVGGVCDASSLQLVKDLHAIVYRVDAPTLAPTFTQVLDVPLDYNRFPSSSGHQEDFDSNWRPWPTAASLAPDPSPSDISRPSFPDPTVGNALRSLAGESYPQLSGISFDADGSMQLAFRDLMGDMSGVDIRGDVHNPTIQGDLLRACPNGSGGWDLENAGACGGVSGFGSLAELGPMGPGGGYFYELEPGTVHGTTPPEIAYQPSNFAGGVLQVPGFAEVTTTDGDPGPVDQSDGIVWRSNGNGADQRGVVNRSGLKLGSFGKSNGIGDLTALVKQAPLQIGDRLWKDLDGDGVQDAGEPVFAGVTVVLTDASGTQIATTTTGADGTYVFDVDPGVDYQVRVPLAQPELDGWAPTRPNGGGDDAVDSDGALNGGALVASVAAHGVGENDHTFDFGFVQPVCVGDYVWFDENGNGVQDPGEPGIAGVTLTLTDAAGNPVTDLDGNPVGPTTTDADGHYGFCNLPPGTYVVHVQPPDGYKPTLPGQGTPESDSSNGSATSVKLNGGERDETLDFGFVKPVCVGDFVWVDENGNGVQDAGEPGIAGVTLTLTDAAGNPVTDMDGNPVGPTTTDGDGHYGFCDLPPGTYVVHVQPPAGYTPSPTGQGTPESDSSTGSAMSVRLNAGERDLTLDFGFVPVAAAPTPTPVATPSPTPTPGAPSEAPRLTLKKSVNHASVKPGAKVRYTLVARNVGGVAATSVQLCDQLPDHLTLAMSGAALKKAGGKLVKGDVCWSLGTLKAGAKVTRTLTVKVDRFAKAGRIVNRATVDRTKVVGVDARAQKAITIAKGKVKGERVSGRVTG